MEIVGTTGQGENRAGLGYAIAATAPEWRPPADETALWTGRLALFKTSGHPGIYEKGAMVVADLTEAEIQLLLNADPRVSYVRPEMPARDEVAMRKWQVGSFATRAAFRSAALPPRMSPHWERTSALKQYVLPAFTRQLTSYMQTEGWDEVGLRVDIVSLLRHSIDAHVGNLTGDPAGMPLRRNVSCLTEALEPTLTAYTRSQIVPFADGSHAFGGSVLPERLTQAITDQTRWAYDDLLPLDDPRLAASIYPAVFVHPQNTQSPQRYEEASRVILLPRTLY